MVEVVPLARKLNKKALRYLDCWAALVERDERRGRASRITLRLGLRRIPHAR